MNKERKAQESRKRRITRVRAKVVGSEARPRLTVRRSLQHIYAQVINDSTGKTTVAASDLDLPKEAVKGKNRMEISQAVGELIAERAKAKDVTDVVFDRRDKKYHGRIKALAEGARKGGLNF